MENNGDISKIKLSDGQVYEIKDLWVRDMLFGTNQDAIKNQDNKK